MKSMMATLATITLFAFASFAQPQQEEKLHFQTQTLEVQEFAVPQMAPNSSITGDLADLINPLNQAELVMDKIINMGKKIWDLVEKGRPVVNYRQSIATALPQGVRQWNQMQGWAGKSLTREVAIINGFGTEKIKFVYRVVFIHDGNIEGKGRYIGYATIEPAQLKVGWGGYKFDAEVSVPTVFNMGSTENPVAGMKIDVRYTVNTMVQHEEHTDSFFITGQGKIQSLQ